MLLHFIVGILLYMVVSFGFAVFVGKFIAVGERD